MHIEGFSFLKLVWLLKLKEAAGINYFLSKVSKRVLR